MMKKCDIAVYGLGVMGSSLARNMLAQGIDVCTYSKNREERERFVNVTNAQMVVDDVSLMIATLRKPRKIFLMITAGKPVDIVIDELFPLLEAGDIIIDGGNSHYEDTNRRCHLCDSKGIHFVGAGISGGEQGALKGPSMMIGGSKEGFMACRNIFEQIAAHSEGRTCCIYAGSEGAGHYVKMVHNGIEYGILQILSEIYYLMRYGLCLHHSEIIKIFESWKDSTLNSYLIDISILVLKATAEDDSPLVERILDRAEQKGTGMWTLHEGIKRQVYIPTIYEAVAARSFSAQQALREKGNKILGTKTGKVEMAKPKDSLRNALELGMLACYSQGLELIRQGSTDFDWKIDLSEVVVSWKSGCIIRSQMLKKIEVALEQPEPIILSSLFDKEELVFSLRECVSKVVMAGIPLPALTSVLHYYDYHRMKIMPVGFIQGLRDCFGAHTYRRNDKDGVFHTEWKER